MLVTKRLHSTFSQVFYFVFENEAISSKIDDKSFLALDSFKEAGVTYFETGESSEKRATKSLSTENQKNRERIMNITYNETNRVFSIETEHTGYYIGIVDTGYVAHIHFGKKLGANDNLLHLLRVDESPFVPSTNEGDACVFNDSFFWEYPTGGIGDFRESCLNVSNELGQNACSLIFTGYEILQGKTPLHGLPATWGSETNCKTLLIHCTDSALSLSVTLSYSIFEGIDAIAKSVFIKNEGKTPIALTKAYSSCLELDNNDFEFLSLHGSWARERHIERTPLHHGRTNVSSLRGETSHQESSFFALVQKNADYNHGEVYGFSLVYSGNFISQAELNQFDYVRAVTGIYSEGFSWHLLPNESFTTPESVIVYSDCGLGKMQRNFHDLWRMHLIRSEWQNKERPILVNNWEATYFDFDSEKLLSIAKKAHEVGIEMLVMDDGWFGKRNAPDSSLGDWVVNEEKIKGGLKNLVENVNSIGLQFGLWVEPEMISPDSDLYRAHPDWAICIPNRNPTLCRNQLVLDLSRKTVRDYVFDSISAILHSANIVYVKWDMNRQLTDLGSASLAKEHAGELYHRSVLGVYELQERLITEFPHILLENCSGGGARFDAGMLYYSPQIWCSDDMDPVERLMIHEGTALCYPPCTMGAHIAVEENHTTGRKTPFMTRAFTALSGTFGYELDITKLKETDISLIPHQVELYKRFNHLVRSGDYFRIASYSENHEWDSWLFASKDKSEMVLTLVQVLNKPNFHSRKVQIPSVQEDANYSVTMENSKGEEANLGEWQGNTLKNAGLLIPRFWGDFHSALIFIKKI